MKKFTYILLVITLFTTSYLFASGNKEIMTTNKPVIAVSILPQKYAVDRIAGDLVETIVLVGEGQSPHSYEPTPRQMSLLSSSSAWILSGTDFEQALIGKIKALYPNLLIIDGTQGVTFRLLEKHDHAEDEEMHDEDHHDEENTLLYDKHTWLSYSPYKLLIGHIYDTLIEIDEKNKKFANYIKIIDKINNSTQNCAILRNLPTDKYEIWKEFKVLFTSNSKDQLQ